MATSDPVHSPEGKRLRELEIDTFMEFLSSSMACSYNKVYMFQLSFLAIFHNCHHSSSCYLTAGEISLYENLTLCLWPAAITLNYSINDVRNDVQQIIIIMILYEKSHWTH